MKIFHLFVWFNFLFIFQSAEAQNENSIWKFGNGLGLDFRSCPPTQLYEGASNTWENSCAISDPSTGNLLFYTNNSGIYDKNDRLMPNGNINALNSNSVTQITIVPHPNKDSGSLYFIFSCKPQSGSNGPVVYHVVDMTKNGGLGDVVLKNVLLHAGPMNEKVIAIRASDRKSFRVIFHGYLNDIFYTYKIDESGLDLTPVETPIGKVIDQPCMSNGANIGSLVASPDGKSLAYLNFCDKEFQLFKFDYNSGVISDYLNIKNQLNPTNPNNLSTSWGGYYGGSFSPNSKLLYVTTMGANLDLITDIYQMDVSKWNSTDIEKSIYTVKRFKDTMINGTNIRGSAKHLKIGPDGKIYVGMNYLIRNSLSDKNSIDFCMPAIQYPDSPGSACGFEDCAIRFNPASKGKRYTDYGGPPLLLESWCLNNLYEMPIQPKIKQRITGITKTINCQYTKLEPISKPKESVLKTVWSDQNTQVPRYRDRAFGTLWVDQETECYIYRDSLILDKRKKTSGKTFSDCIQPNGLVLKFLSDTNTLISLVWNDEDSSKTASIHVSKTGTYLLTMTRNCDVVTDTFRIRNQTRSIGSKNNLCIGDGQNLKPPIRSTVYNQYIWSNGSHSDRMMVTHHGIYWVDVVSSCDTIRDSFFVSDRQHKRGLMKSFCPGDDISAISLINGKYKSKWNNGSELDTIKHALEGNYWIESITDCEIIRDSIVVKPIHIKIPNLSNDTVICGKSLLYSLAIDTNLYTVKWKNGIQGATIKVNTKYEFPFKVYSKSGCDWDSGRIRVYNLPNRPVYFENSFTPNSDGFNELFPSFQFDDIDRIESIQVYSRWGDLIYSATNQRWDGTFDGEPCPDGIYLCKIVYRNCDFTRSYFSSMITLLR